MLRFKKTSWTFKDFGKFFYKLWSKNFFNYTSIMVLLFALNTAQLNVAFNVLYDTIFQMFQVYKWQQAILLLAIKAYTHILSLMSLDSTMWEIHNAFESWFCNPLIVLGSANLSAPDKQKWSYVPLTRRVAKALGGLSNNPSITCKVFNKCLHSWANCKRVHKC